MVLEQLTTTPLPISVQKELIQLLKQEIEHLDILGAIIFGSVSRLEMNPFSDLDLLVIVENDSQKKPTISALSKISSTLKCSVDFVVVTRLFYLEKKGQCGIVSEAYLNGLVIKGDPQLW